MAGQPEPRWHDALFGYRVGHPQGDWQLDDAQRDLLAFTQCLLALRAAHPVFRRRDFFQGRPLFGSAVRDIVWLRPDGSEMSEQDWRHEHARALTVLLSGDGLNEVDARGRAVRDDSFALLFNAGADALSFALPADLAFGPGELLLDTSSVQGPLDSSFDAALPFELAGRALALVRFARQPRP